MDYYLVTLVSKQVEVEAASHAEARLIALRDHADGDPREEVLNVERLGASEHPEN